jgi:hypothetical protein
MERLANGVMHIPIFLNSFHPGLYYTKILVRPTTALIPYGGPNEDLDITAADVVAATGIVFRCSADGNQHTTTTLSRLCPSLQCRRACFSFSRQCLSGFAIK